MEKKFKQYAVEVEPVAERKMAFTITTAAVDRDGDVINPKGWQLDNFRKNPVVLWAHDYNQLPVGKAVNIVSTKDGLKAEVEFPPIGTYPFADQVHDMVQAGFLNATSVGFAPIEHEMAKGRDRGFDFHKQELLEFSIVPVPCNPEALAQRGITDEQAKTWAKSISRWADKMLGKKAPKLDEAQFGELSTAIAKILAEDKPHEPVFDAKAIAGEVIALIEAKGILKSIDIKTLLDADALRLIAVDVAKRLKGVPPPQAGESQDEFYKRCMGDPGMNGEYPDDDQRSAMCTARWQEPQNPSGADDKAISKEILDIQYVPSEIAWDKITVEKKTESITTEQISTQILTAMKDALREMAGAEARAAINRMTGRLD